jgi:hypothetical protein
VLLNFCNTLFAEKVVRLLSCFTLFIYITGTFRFRDIICRVIIILTDTDASANTRTCTHRHACTHMHTHTQNNSQISPDNGLLFDISYHSELVVNTTTFFNELFP